MPKTRRRDARSRAAIRRPAPTIRPLGACDTARGMAGRGAGHGAQGRARARCHTAGPGHDTAGPDYYTALGGATIRPCARGLGVPMRTGWACWLGQLGQFGCLVHLTHFGSIFGLSTVPESLNEHWSSQKKNFKKKLNKIKSNKMGQNFG